MAGSIALGMSKASSSSSSHSSVSRFISIVRDALVGSVTCAAASEGPPVSFQISQLSTVPNKASPVSASRRSPGT